MTAFSSKKFWNIYSFRALKLQIVFYNIFNFLFSLKIKKKKKTKQKTKKKKNNNNKNKKIKPGAFY